MKYIKKYEMIYDIEDFDINYFIHELGDTIDKIIKDFPLLKTEKGTVYLRLKQRDKRTNVKYKIYDTFLTIKQYHLKDKKIRDISLSDRQKIRIHIDYTTSHIMDKEMPLNIINFLMDIFKRNSYFHQVSKWDKRYNDFFIDKSKIPEILSEIENNLDLFISTSKYNL